MCDDGVPSSKICNCPYLDLLYIVYSYVHEGHARKTNGYGEPYIGTAGHRRCPGLPTVQASPGAGWLSRTVMLLVPSPTAIHPDVFAFLLKASMLFSATSTSRKPALPSSQPGQIEIEIPTVRLKLLLLTEPPIDLKRRPPHSSKVFLRTIAPPLLSLSMFTNTPGARCPAGAKTPAGISSAKLTQ